MIHKIYYYIHRFDWKNWLLKNCRIVLFLTDRPSPIIPRSNYCASYHKSRKLKLRERDVSLGSTTQSCHFCKLSQTWFIHPPSLSTIYNYSGPLGTATRLPRTTLCRFQIGCWYAWRVSAARSVTAAEAVLLNYYSERVSRVHDSNFVRIANLTDSLVRQQLTMDDANSRC